MIPLIAIFLVLAAHFIGDFFCQTQWIAENKSKSTRVLMLHCVIYGAVLFIFSPLISLSCSIPMIEMWKWITFNASLHFAVDIFTSLIYLFYYKNSGFKRGFFNTLAGDQFIHIGCLFGVLSLL